jgi:hypothetical protein
MWSFILRQVRLWSSSELSPQSSSPSQIQDWEIQRPLAHLKRSDQQVGSAVTKHRYNNQTVTIGTLEAVWPAGRLSCNKTKIQQSNSDHCHTWICLSNKSTRLLIKKKMDTTTKQWPLAELSLCDNSLYKNRFWCKNQTSLKRIVFIKCNNDHKWDINNKPQCNIKSLVWFNWTLH